MKNDARVVQEDVQTLLTRNIGPHKPHQNPPEVLWELNGRPDHGPGYDKRWGAEWFARRWV